jgi:phosphoglycolate phosphatase
MIRTVIFDFDGTIVNSRGLMVQLYNDLARKYGYKIIEDDEIEFMSTLSITDRCKALGVPLYRVPQLGVYAKANYQNLIQTLEANPGIRELISELKGQGHHLSIISSNLESSIRTFLDHNRMEGFDSIFSAKNFFGKHHTIKAFLRQMKLSNRESIYIGDELRDIEACRKAHIRIISVAWGYDSPELLFKAQPDFLASHPEQIPQVIEEMKA